MIFLKKKRRLLELLKTIIQMTDLLENENEQANVIANCQTAISTIYDNLIAEFSEKETVFADLQAVYDLLTLINEQEITVNAELTVKMKQLLQIIFSKLDKLIPLKLNVAFMPYKVTMWDSLASIYETAQKDPDCVTKVIPIPYYKLADSQKIPTYEGDLFPEDVKITPFDQYNLEQEEPDIIFIHNAYDQFDTITQVDERFFTSNLKKYTNMLVYVPYHITGLRKLTGNNQYFAYTTPTMGNIDKIIVAGQYVKDAAIKYGIPAEKVLALGSPKLDAVYQVTKKGKNIPPKWQNQLTGKFVFALDTNCMFLINDSFYGLAFIEQVFDAARMIPNCAVIWRPHPLTRISIAHYLPQMLERYDQMVKEIKERSPRYPNIIFDDGAEYQSFLNSSDAYISQPNSLMASYTITNRPIIIASDKLDKYNLMPDEAFYHFYDLEYPWQQIAKDLVNGKDIKRKYRKNLANSIYSYTDGTSGKRIYEEIKKENLNNFLKRNFKL